MACSSARRRPRSRLPGLLCLGCGASLLAFVGPCRNPAVRRSVANSATPDAAPEPAKAPEGESPEEVAERTRGVFMSLDTDEFGINDADQAKIPDKPKEKTIIDKAGDSAASLGAVAVFTVVIIGVTFYVFFTKQAEESFYFSGVRDRVGRYSAEEVGVDFRGFTSDQIESARALKQAIEAEMGKEEAPPPEAEPTPSS
mmetsp:Transcript_74901/g.173637  ORF Transcript_74901/g.173637 Transcript_74901/m.173637 type:complete len:199 (-) Transcript_74901:67-663(-)